MSRIRSVHPGLFTDERFVSVSPFARLLFIGLWTECDDKGSFEWSPIKLKMRLLPADNIDISECLLELEMSGIIMSYSIKGRKFGAVRKFSVFQRPKKPNDIYPQTEMVRNFVTGNCEESGNECQLSCEVSEIDGPKVIEFPQQAETVTNQFPTDGEKPPQMEDGEEGGKKERTTSVVPKKVRGSRIPEDFKLDADLLAWTIEESGARFTAMIPLQLAKFKDYWAGRAGEKGVKLDWPATWRNWWRTFMEDKPKSDTPDIGRAWI